MASSYTTTCYYPGISNPMPEGFTTWVPIPGYKTTRPTHMLLNRVYEPTISRHQNLQYFYGVIPSLSVALVDGDYDPSTTQPPSFSTRSLPSPSHLVPFSHFIRLLYPSSSEKGLQGGSCYTQYLHETGVWVLNLVIGIQEAANTTTNGDFSTTKPGDHERINVESRALLLTEQQLLWAKDFLCLALPFNDSGDWVTDSLSSEAVHVLITAPLQQPSLGLGMQTSGRNWHVHPHADQTGKTVSSYLASMSKRSARNILVNLERDLSAHDGDASAWILETKQIRGCNTPIREAAKVDNLFKDLWHLLSDDRPLGLSPYLLRNRGSLGC